MILLTADLLLLPGGPLAGWGLAIDGPLIRDVAPRELLIARYGGAAREHYPGACLMPGLVNCHTHLDLTGLQGNLPAASSFVAWLQEMIARRLSLSEEFSRESAERGLRELLRCGTTCVADISSTGASVPPLVQGGVRAIVYHEILGLDPEEAPARLGRVRESLSRAAEITAPTGGRVRLGLSPHAPYSLSEPLLRGSAALAQDWGLPLSIHLAESSAERSYIATGTGPLCEELLPRVGRSHPSHTPRGESPAQFLDRYALLTPSTVAVHGVHLSGADLALLEARSVSLAHCPRSNAALSVGTAPLSTALAAGLCIGLGTDSAASSGSLNLWEEMRAAREIHGGRVASATLLRLATAGGAEVLGLDKETGSLEVNKQADLIAVRLHTAPQELAEPLRLEVVADSLITHTREEDILLTLVEGRRRP